MTAIEEGSRLFPGMPYCSTSMNFAVVAPTGQIKFSDRIRNGHTVDQFEHLSGSGSDPLISLVNNITDEFR